MQTKEWITMTVAVCALLLSAYKAYNIYLQRRDKGPRLRLRAHVDHHHDFSMSQDPETGVVTCEKDSAVVVKLENIGEREYTLKDFAFKPLLRKRFAITAPVRAKLAPESRTEAAFRARDLLSAQTGKPKSSLVGRIEVRDHMGRRFRSQFLMVTGNPKALSSQ